MKAGTLALLCLAVMAFLAAGTDRMAMWFAYEGRSPDYYNLLTRGLQKGHLYLDAAVDPRLLSPDPAVRGQADFILDASLYRGRYYLYFGLVPALLLFLPYAHLTGRYLAENAACLLLVAGGFACHLAVYRSARRRYFPKVPFSLEAACVLLLAFASGTPAVLTASGTYEVAVAGAYAMLAAAWLCLFRAAVSAGRPWLWFGLAGIAVGGAVGCRPDLVLACPALAAAVPLLGSRGRGGRARAAWAELAAAAGGAAAVGAGLAAYNFARFGNPFEFGVRYQIGNASNASLRFIGTNLRWYYLTPPVLSPYFPFVFPINASVGPPGYICRDVIHGQWLVFMAALATAAGWWRWRRRARPEAPFPAYLGILLGAFVCLLLGLACFGGRTDRYVVDFQGTLVLLLALAGSAAAAAAPPRLWPNLWRGLLTTLAAVAALHNLFAGIQYEVGLDVMRPRTYRALAEAGNYPSELLRRLGWIRPGPVGFDAVFRPVAQATEMALLAAGTSNIADVLYAVQYADGHVVLSLNHEGAGGVASRRLPIEYGRPYHFEVDLGSLYPPRLHPYFRGWDPKDVEKLKTTGRVLFDGREVIRCRLNFYDAPPNAVVLGRAPDGTDPPFNGRLSHLRRLPPRDVHGLGLFNEPGVWRLRLELPLQPTPGGYPVLGSGVAGHGNLLLLEVTPDHRFRFRCDQWGAGMTSSPFLGTVGLGDHLLEIFAGPRVATQHFPAAWGIDVTRLGPAASALRVWLDGRPVWTTEIVANPDSYDLVSVGSNPQGFSTARMLYAGPIESEPYAPAELAAFIARNL